MRPRTGSARLAGIAGAGKRLKGKRPDGTARLLLSAIGIESEFSLVVDDRPARPEDVFGDPRAFLGGSVMHRTGTSYHLRTGGAVYFDTGVIEVTTPVIEIERGCAARAGRSLWEGIVEVRAALDEWERRTGHRARLVGFSTHYNVSLAPPNGSERRALTAEKLALLLSYILPAPVMLLGANRRSTGIGVRPRRDRIEVTVDFTPSAALMIATATVIVGVAREVMTWPSFELEMLEREDIPVIEGFRPVPHTSRHGWLARFSCYPANPFAAPVDAPTWPIGGGDVLSLRAIARRIVRRFWLPVRRISDPFTLRLIGSIVRGRGPTLLELEDRPPEYDDVGHLCTWDLFPARSLSRSRYERVLIRAIAGRRLRMFGRTYAPVRMEGWSSVVFRRDDAGTLHTFPIDYLVEHLRHWG